MKTVIIYGPMACGKTRNADAFAAHFGCNSVVDDWDPHQHQVIEGALHLTNHVPISVRVPDGTQIIKFPQKLPHLPPANNRFPRIDANLHRRQKRT